MTPRFTPHSERHGPQPVESWQAWKLGERESYPLVIEADTIEEAVNDSLLALCWNSGDILAVQHSHAGLRRYTLWQFKVSRSSRHGVWRDSTNGGRKVFVGRPEAKLICQTALAEPFAPVKPFDAFRDDPVGRDPTLVDAFLNRDGER